MKRKIALSFLIVILSVCCFELGRDNGYRSVYKFMSENYYINSKVKPFGDMSPSLHNQHYIFIPNVVTWNNAGNFTQGFYNTGTRNEKVRG